jgi:hypothetical protein
VRLDVVDLEVIDLEVVELEVVDLEVVDLEVVDLEVVDLEVGDLEGGLAIVPDHHHIRSGSELAPIGRQIRGPGCQQTGTENLGMVP